MWPNILTGLRSGEIRIDPFAARRRENPRVDGARRGATSFDFGQSSEACSSPSRAWPPACPLHAAALTAQQASAAPAAQAAASSRIPTFRRSACSRRRRSRLHRRRRDLRALARLFKLHKFRQGDRLPESPFVLVVAGLVQLFTDTGTHDPVIHGRGAFFTTCTAAIDVSRRSADRSSGIAQLCGCTEDNSWDEWIYEEIEEEPVVDRRQSTAPGARQSVAAPRRASTMPAGRTSGAPAASNPAGGGRLSLAAPGGIPMIRKPHTKVSALSEGLCLLLPSRDKLPKHMHRLLRAAECARRSSAGWRVGELVTPFTALLLWLSQRDRKAPFTRPRHLQARTNRCESL